MNKELKTKLTEIKDRMMAGKVKLLGLVEIKKENGEILSNIKRDLILEIAEELDTNGKPAFSNQIKRDAEFDIRIVKNTKYSELIDDNNKIEKEINEIQIKIENAHYDFRIEEILSRYGE